MSTTARSPKLPPEILLHIVPYACDAALYNLCLTSKLFCPHAQSLLFSTIVCSAEKPIVRENSVRMTSLISTLNRRPDLLLRITTLTFFLIRRDDCPYYIHDLMYTIIQGTPQLDHIQLYQTGNGEDLIYAVVAAFHRSTSACHIRWLKLASNVSSDTAILLYNCIPTLERFTMRTNPNSHGEIAFGSVDIHPRLRELDISYISADAVAAVVHSCSETLEKLTISGSSTRVSFAVKPLPRLSSIEFLGHSATHIVAPILNRTRMLSHLVLTDPFLPVEDIDIMRLDSVETLEVGPVRYNAAGHHECGVEDIVEILQAGHFARLKTLKLAVHHIRTLLPYLHANVTLLEAFTLRQEELTTLLQWLEDCSVDPSYHLKSTSVTIAIDLVITNETSREAILTLLDNSPLPKGVTMQLRYGNSLIWPTAQSITP